MLLYLSLLLAALAAHGLMVFALWQHAGAIHHPIHHHHHNQARTASR